MERYPVKKWGHSLHVVLNKKLHKPGDVVCVIKEGDFISIDLLIMDLLELKKRVEVLENGNIFN